MRFTTTLICCLTACLYFFNGTAQSITWDFSYTHDYTTIKPYYSEGMFEVEKHGKKGVIRSNGDIIVPVENDNISLMYNNLAIVTKNEERGERVAGCLTREGKYIPFSQPYYTLSGQKFYSDGLLSVHDANGMAGYINPLGKEVVGFDGRYDLIKPFSEGFAAVFKNKRYSLIDKDGRAVRFTFPNVAELYGGTNVYQGQVYVWDTEGRFYTYNVRNGGYCKKARKPKNTSIDYLYRFGELTKMTHEIPYDKVKEEASSLVPFESSGLWGYKAQDVITVIPQFTQAGNFIRNLSVVEKEGEWGIIRYLPDESFSLTPYNQGGVRFSNGTSSVKCQLQINLPAAWREKKIEAMAVDMKSKKEYQLNKEGNDWSFQVKTNGKEENTYKIVVTGNHLILYHGLATFHLTPLCRTCHKDLDVCPYKGNHPAPQPQQPVTPNKTKIKYCKDCGLPENECPYKGVH